MAVSAMAMIPKIALTAATLLLLNPVATLAQDTGDAAQSSQTPTVDRAQGVPDDFTLPPGPSANPGNRLEPMVQPLPRPSASPTPTPTATSAPSRQSPQPTPTATSRQAAPSQAAPSQVAPSRRQPSASSTAAPRTEPTPQPEQSEVASEPDTPVAEQSAPTQSAADQREPIPAPQNGSAVPLDAEPETESSGWGFLALLLGGIVLLALGALAFWWQRLGKGEILAVEKIEPYRPPPKPENVEKERQPQPSAPTLASAQAASRPAPAAANPGGFVTSTIATRRPAQQGALAQPQLAQPPQRQTSQAPRGNVAPDGRIVTSLSSLRKRPD